MRETVGIMIAPHNGLDWHLTVTVLSAYPLFTTALGDARGHSGGYRNAWAGAHNTKTNETESQSEKAPKSAARSRRLMPRRKSGSTASSTAGRAPTAGGLTLVVVESPTKARTISNILGPQYRVLASKDISPTCRNMSSGTMSRPSNPCMRRHPSGPRIWPRSKEAARHADRVIIATDPDREGEGDWLACGTLTAGAQSRSPGVP